MKQINSTKDCFNYDDHLKFVCNNVNNERWFADHDVVYSYFQDVAAKLLVIKCFINIKKIQSSL